MLLLALTLPIGCIKNGVQPSEVDEAVAAALADASCVTQADLDAAVETAVANAMAEFDCVTQDELDSSGYVTDDELAVVQADVQALSVSTLQILIDDADGAEDGEVTWEVNTAGTGDYPTIPDAISALDGYHIPADVTLTIQVADGSYLLAEPLTFHHPDGRRVRLVGDEASPTNVTLIACTACSGIVVDAGSTLGFVGGFSLVGDGTIGTPTDEIAGIQVTQGSVATLGKLQIRGFDTGVGVWGASFVQADDRDASAPWLTISDCVGYGVRVDGLSMAYLPSVVVTGSTGGDGIRAERGSFLYADGSTSSANAQHGFVVMDNAGAEFSNSTSSANGQSGFLVSRAGFGLLSSATATGNTANAFEADYGALAYAPSSTGSGGADAYVASVGSVLVGSDSTASSYTGYGYRSLYGSFIAAPDSTASGTLGYYAGQHAGLYAENGVAGTCSVDGNSWMGLAGADVVSATPDASSWITY